MRPLKILSLGLVLALLVAGCGPSATLVPPDIGTIVAETMLAVTPPPPLATPTLPPTAANLLPRSLYFLNNDAGGLLQVFRIGREGTTTQQLTFEPAPVGNFDVSPADGSIAYISNNQLMWADANGAGRRVLVDGGPPRGDNNFMDRLGTVVWSPDGATIAYSYNGLNFYAMASGASTRTLEDQIDNSAGFPVVRELYGPNEYSPDGSKLLINIGYYESGTLGVYDVSSGSFVRFTNPDGGPVCCNANWVPDGSGLYAANRELGMLDSGLWYLDLSTGSVTTLLPGSAPDDSYNSAAEPVIGPDGLLYFFFNNLTTSPSLHTPLYMVRSASDGVTGRVQLRPESFENINEILWSPDASLAVLAIGATPDVYAGGAAVIVYADGRPALPLANFVTNMHWGP